MNQRDTLALLVARHVFTLMGGRTEGQINDRTRRETSQHGRTLGRVGTGNLEARLQVTHRDQPRASSHINENYCVTKLQARLLAGSSPQGQTIDICTNLNAKPHVVTSVHTTPGHSQKRELSPGSAGDYKLKYVKSVSFVTQLSCVQPVTNVTNAASNLPVGARLQNFWQTWLDLGAGPKVVQILREGYILPFWIQPNLTRSPTVISCYANPNRNLCLLEALHQLIDKKCSGASTKPNISGIFQPTIFDPKAQQQVETYIRSEQTESFPQGRENQNGDTGNHQDIYPTRGVGYLNRFQGRLLPYSNTGTVQEIFEISCPGSDIPIQSTAFQSVHRHPWSSL